ncbi:hypothetical protein OAJ00_00170 [Paracoccaceae bacterium]|nr:hypothetical protein [Paracoccaceae bacterium]
MKSIIFILAASMIILTGCFGSSVEETPVNGYVTPKGINAVPSQ